MHQRNVNQSNLKREHDKRQAHNDVGRLSFLEQPAEENFTMHQRNVNQSNLKREHTAVKVSESSYVPPTQRNYNAAFFNEPSGSTQLDHRDPINDPLIERVTTTSLGENGFLNERVYHRRRTVDQPGNSMLCTNEPKEQVPQSNNFTVPSDEQSPFPRFKHSGIPKLSPALTRDVYIDHYGKRGYRVVVSNMKESFTQHDIEALFRSVGAVHKVSILCHGVAEVIYKTQTDAHEAVAAFNSYAVDGQIIRCALK